LGSITYLLKLGRVLSCFSLGLITKVKGMERWGPRMQLENYIHTPKNVKECVHTLPSKLPLWELESQKNPKNLKNDSKGQNSLDWWFFYTIENLLKYKCIKWVRMIHLNIFTRQVMAKKRAESQSVNLTPNH
jgi:hypothetical protein